MGTPSVGANKVSAPKETNLEVVDSVNMNLNGDISADSHHWIAIK